MDQNALGLFNIKNGFATHVPQGASNERMKLLLYKDGKCVTGMFQQGSFFEWLNLVTL
jgi:hypothetical protein